VGPLKHLGAGRGSLATTDTVLNIKRFWRLTSLSFLSLKQDEKSLITFHVKRLQTVPGSSDALEHLLFFFLGISRCLRGSRALTFISAGVSCKPNMRIFKDGP